MKKLLKKLNITIGYYKYRIHFLTSGKMYITRVFTHKGLEKYMAGKLTNKSGIV